MSLGNFKIEKREGTEKASHFQFLTLKKRALKVSTFECSFFLLFLLSGGLEKGRCVAEKPPYISPQSYSKHRYSQRSVKSFIKKLEHT